MYFNGKILPSIPGEFCLFFFLQNYSFFFRYIHVLNFPLKIQNIILQGLGIELIIFQRHIYITGENSQLNSICRKTPILIHHKIQHKEIWFSRIWPSTLSYNSTNPVFKYCYLFQMAFCRKAQENVKTNISIKNFFSDMFIRLSIIQTALRIFFP